MSGSARNTGDVEQGKSQLEQELAFYDDCDVSECEGVSPRAFPTEIGYDLSLEQIPPKLGQGLVKGIATAAPAFTLVQTFGNPGFEDKVEDFESLLDRKAYRQVNVYRLDEPENESGEPFFGRWGNYGWVVEYSAFGDSEIDERPHNETTGYYYASHDDVTSMVRTLLFEEEQDSWVLGRMDDSHVLSSDVQYRIEKRGHVAHSDVL